MTLVHGNPWTPEIWQMVIPAFLLCCCPNAEPELSVYRDHQDKETGGNGKGTDGEKRQIRDSIEGQAGIS